MKVFNFSSDDSKAGLNIVKKSVKILEYVDIFEDKYTIGYSIYINP